MNTSPIAVMNTLSQVMEKLRLKGWDHEFHFSPKGFYLKEKHFYAPEALEIIKTYRFEGDSNPSDSSILYILRTRDGQVGYILDAYGVYSTHDESGYDNYIRRIPLSHREEQMPFDL